MIKSSDMRVYGWILCDGIVYQVTREPVVTDLLMNNAYQEAQLGANYDFELSASCVRSSDQAAPKSGL